MNRYFFLSLVGVLQFCMPLGAAVPDGYIYIDVSIKAIVSPSTGLPDPAMNDARLLESFDVMNRWLDNTWRGYRLRPIGLDQNGHFQRIGGISGSQSEPSAWYLADLKDETVSTYDDFEARAQEDKALYAWSDTAVNVYINNGPWSRAGFSSAHRKMFITGYGIFRYALDLPGQTVSEAYKIAGNLLHEMGHHFELFHTFPDDAISDTAPDPIDLRDPSKIMAGDPPFRPLASGRNDTAVRNYISQYTYGNANYSALTAAQKVLVNNTANNAMSYYQLFYDDPPQGKALTDEERYGPTRFILTEKQMDKWADFANNERVSEVSGIMRFVDGSVASSGFGTSTSPIKVLSIALTASNSNGKDILMMRPGVYTATTLSKPMTIRATRTGSVQIQKP